MRHLIFHRFIVKRCDIKSQFALSAVRTNWENIECSFKEMNLLLSRCRYLVWKRSYKKLFYRQRFLLGKIIIQMADLWLFAVKGGAPMLPNPFAKGNPSKLLSSLKCSKDGNGIYFTNIVQAKNSTFWLCESTAHAQQSVRESHMLLARASHNIEAQLSNRRNGDDGCNMPSDKIYYAF